MKYTKVFFGDKRLKDVVVGATKWQVFKYRFVKMVRKVAIASFIIGLVYGSFHLGRKTTQPEVVFADREVMVEVEKESPVLKRIAVCESGGSHYNKDGQVIMRANTNGTVDTGKFQINSVWNKKAGEMKLDLTKEADNETFAKWLYANKGTEPWYSSKTCWNK